MKSKKPTLTNLLKAASEMDWGQVVANGGPPCFQLCVDGHFCGRAQRWQGHGDLHEFVPLDDLMRNYAHAALEEAAAPAPKE